MTEEQRLIWLLSIQDYAEVNRYVFDLTEVSYSTVIRTKTQQGNIGKSKIKKDTHTILKYLHERNSFTFDVRL